MRHKGIHHAGQVTPQRIIGRFGYNQISQYRPDHPSQAKPCRRACQPARWPSQAAQASQPSWRASDLSQPGQVSQSRQGKPGQANHEPARPSQPNHPVKPISGPNRHPRSRAKPASPGGAQPSQPHRHFLYPSAVKVTRGGCQKVVFGDPGGPAKKTFLATRGDSQRLSLGDPGRPGRPGVDAPC